MKKAFIGLTLALLSAFLIALSYILMKIGDLTAQKRQTQFFKVLIWWMGFFVLIFSQILFVVSLGFAHQTTVSISSTVSMLFNMVLAWKCLNEHL